MEAKTATWPFDLGRVLCGLGCLVLVFKKSGWCHVEEGCTSGTWDPLGRPWGEFCDPPGCWLWSGEHQRGEQEDDINTVLTSSPVAEWHGSIFLAGTRTGPLLNRKRAALTVDVGFGARRNSLFLIVSPSNLDELSQPPLQLGYRSAHQVRLIQSKEKQGSGHHTDSSVLLRVAEGMSSFGGHSVLSITSSQLGWQPNLPWGKSCREIWVCSQLMPNSAEWKGHRGVECAEVAFSLQFGATTWRVEPPRFRGGLLQEQNTAYADLFTTRVVSFPYLTDTYCAFEEKKAQLSPAGWRCSDPGPRAARLGESECFRDVSHGARQPQPPATQRPLTPAQTMGTLENEGSVVGLKGRECVARQGRQMGRRVETQKQNLPPTPSSRAHRPGYLSEPLFPSEKYDCVEGNVTSTSWRPALSFWPVSEPTHQPPLQVSGTKGLLHPEFRPAQSQRSSGIILRGLQGEPPAPVSETTPCLPPETSSQVLTSGSFRPTPCCLPREGMGMGEPSPCCPRALASGVHNFWCFNLSQAPSAPGPGPSTFGAGCTPALASAPGSGCSPGAQPILKGRREGHRCLCGLWPSCRVTAVVLVFSANRAAPGKEEAGPWTVVLPLFPFTLLLTLLLSPCALWLWGGHIGPNIKGPHAWAPRFCTTEPPARDAVTAVAAGSEAQALCPQPQGLAHLITLASHPELAQGQGVQGELGRGQAQGMDLRGTPLAELQWEVMIPTTSPGKGRKHLAPGTQGSCPHWDRGLPGEGLAMPICSYSDHWTSAQPDVWTPLMPSEGNCKNREPKSLDKVSHQLPRTRLQLLLVEAQPGEGPPGSLRLQATIPCGRPWCQQRGGKSMGVPAYSPSGEITFLRKMHWDWRLEIARGRGQQGEGTLRTPWKPGDQGCRTREDSDPVSGWNPQPWGPDRELSSLGEGPTFSPQGTAGAPDGVSVGSGLHCSSCSPETQGTARSEPREQSGRCGLGSKSSNHSGSLGLPTSRPGPHKEVRGVLTPSALGLMGPVPLTAPLGSGLFPLQPCWEGGCVGVVMGF
ncbi:hypothetical protein Cadr_000020189 [Camelus dromedarius]|uniref:Uncharacterized protein n=1 Tax=Camelus dromedarius TaxID=9838 RepID=A0A5N4CYF2_CAMDR|nr:hypothetical protein Cadr_000020189 [Camelus dromedarius]